MDGNIPNTSSSIISSSSSNQAVISQQSTSNLDNLTNSSDDTNLSTNQPYKDQKNTDDQNNIIYLSNDDPRIQEYTHNATEAMNILGIKKSRLHQITGTKLPCARIKIGRYLKPMYRHSDITDYLESLRTPISSAKSHKLINQSLQSLRSYALQINSFLDHDSDTVNIPAQSSENESHPHTIFNKISELSIKINDLNHKIARLNHPSKNLSNTLSFITGIYQKIKNDLDQITITIEKNSHHHQLNEYYSKALHQHKINLEKIEYNLTQLLSNHNYLVEQLSININQLSLQIIKLMDNLSFDNLNSHNFILEIKQKNRFHHNYSHLKSINRSNKSNHCFLSLNKNNQHKKPPISSCNLLLSYQYSSKNCSIHRNKIKNHPIASVINDKSTSAKFHIKFNNNDY